MPFDRTPRGPGGGHDPARTWGERAVCWTALAFYGTIFGAGVFTMVAVFTWSLVTTPVVTALWMPVFGWTLWLLWFLWPSLRALAAGRWP